MAESLQVVVRKGLEGVIVDSTSVSKVMPDINSLTYRGYTVQELCEHCRFEEVAYLLWNKELPSKAQLQEFEKSERALRAISPELAQAMRSFPKKAHPMDLIRTGISFLGMENPDSYDNDPKDHLNHALNMFAKAPTIVAAGFRLRQGLEPIAPKADLGYSENFFHMCFGEVPSKDVIRAFDVSLILYAEHGFNASTFSARVIASTLTDMYGAVTGGIAALKGPLHGGANEQVMLVLKEIGEPSKARAWLDKALAEKRKIMGFGHRVYKSGDSRVPTMNQCLEKLSVAKGDMKWLQIAKELEAAMLEKKNIHPNVDFPTGPAYYLMGFPIDLYTPLFVMSRITGWTAHFIEQNLSNRIIRPLSEYTGEKVRQVLPIDRRA